MLKFLKVRNVKFPEREDGNAGIDFFIPDYDEDLIVDLKSKNQGLTILKDGIYLQPSQSVLIPSGIKSHFDPSIALMAVEKSGQATKKRLAVGACLVDSSYRGEIHLHVYNTGTQPVKLLYGEKLVQFVPFKFSTEELDLRENCTEEDFYKEELKTKRGKGGFGSTGTLSEKEEVSK